MNRFWAILMTAVSALAFVVFFRTPCALGDDARLGRYGETVSPVNDADIVMQSEYVNVRVSKLNSETSCEFVFVNGSGSEKTILMGFPDGGDAGGTAAAGTGLNEDYGLYDFTVSVDGMPVDAKHEKGIKPAGSPDRLNFPYWYTWEVNFKPGEKKTVKNTYRTSNTSRSNGFMQCGYVLATGASWKDRIGYAKITFDFRDIRLYQLESINPGNFRIEGNKLIWEFSDFEPDRNISLNIDLHEDLYYGAGGSSDMPGRLKALEARGDYNGIIGVVDNAIGNRDYDQFNVPSLKTEKAKALLKLGRNDEAAGLLDDVAASNTWGSKQAAYTLLNYYKETGSKKYREFYEKKVFLHMNGIMQRLAQQMFPDLKSSYKPESFNIKVTPTLVDAVVEDRDDDLESFSVEVWYLENGRKLHLADYKVDEFPSGRYMARYAASLQPPLGDGEIYYRVCARDSAGNVLDTGEKKVMPVSESNGSHWSDVYAQNFSWIQEVSDNAAERDKSITNRDLFNLLAKSNYLDIGRRTEQESIFTLFLNDTRPVSRAEAMNFIACFMKDKGYEGFKMPDSTVAAEKQAERFNDWDAVPPEYREGVLPIIGAGAVIGFPGGMLKPMANITTNEVLAILSRIKYGITSKKEAATADTEKDRLLKAVLGDDAARKWYEDHAGSRFVLCEEGQWYILEDEKTGIKKQRCTEELAVRTMNTMPDIYISYGGEDAEINILQKLGSPPHRYVLVADPKTLALKSSRIEDY